MQGFSSRLPRGSPAPDRQTIPVPGGLLRSPIERPRVTQVPAESACAPKLGRVQETLNGLSSDGHRATNPPLCCGAVIGTRNHGWVESGQSREMWNRLGMRAQASGSAVVEGSRT